MYDFEYVSRKEAAPYKKELIEIINKVQDQVRSHFTFQFTFIGSSERNMITCDFTTNKGFDFDVNIEINDDKEYYKPKEIRDILREALNRVALSYGYSPCEDSTRVLTIKCVDYQRSSILHSCDFAIVHTCKEGQQYIRYRKQSKTYTWEFQRQPYRNLERKADALKKKNLWDEVLTVYLNKKNRNMNPDKHSRALYAETINECYQRHFGK